MPLNEDDLQFITNILSPLDRPIDTISKDTLARRFNEVFNLQPKDAGTMDLETDDAISREYLINEQVLPVLQNMHIPEHIPEYYDCEERAFWVAAHVRNKLPGIPLGVMTGTAKYGPPSINGKKHAVNFFVHSRREKWFFDALQLSGIEGPTTEAGEPIKIPMNPIDATFVFPFKGLIDKSAFLLDDKFMIYKLDGNDGILTYIENAKYEQTCPEDHKITFRTAHEERFLHYDRALWTYAHIRRDYPGSAVCIGISDIQGETPAVLIIWHKKNDQEKGLLDWSLVDPVNGELIDKAKSKSLKMVIL